MKLYHCSVKHDNGTVVFYPTVAAPSEMAAKFIALIMDGQVDVDSSLSFKHVRGIATQFVTAVPVDPKEREKDV